MPTSQVVWRSRVAVMCIALSALCFHQSPGLIVPDTKLDLVVDPGRFLGRSLQAWDPTAYFGPTSADAPGPVPSDVPNGR